MGQNEEDLKVGDVVEFAKTSIGIIVAIPQPGVFNVDWITAPKEHFFPHGNCDMFFNYTYLLTKITSIEMEPKS